MIYDVIVIGSGVAGINSAIYAASEGLSVLVIGKQFGGQIYSSAAVENFFSHDKVTGRQLINRGYAQAVKFGTEFANDTIKRIYKFRDNTFHVESETSVYYGKTVILALGVQYRTLEANGVENHLGTHIHTGDNVLNHAQRCKNKHVYIVGGANSAGQAAVYLAKYASKVTMLVRSTLEKSMSAYLIQQIENAGNIEVLEGCTLKSVDGSDKLERVIVNHNGNDVSICDCSKLFVFIGAAPMTDWLPESIARDDQGYVAVDYRQMTIVKGIFAVGDIVSGSVKRVVTALGSSATAISNVHQYLAEVW